MRTVVVLLLVVACHAPVPTASDPPTRGVVAPNHGLVFDLPDGWTELATAGGRAFMGPADTPTAFATIAWQTAPPAPDLETSLQSMQAAIEQRVSTELHVKPALIGGHGALFYVHTFDWIDIPRTRAGALISGPRGIVDISCSAPTAVFGAAASVFEGLLDTLTLF